MDKNSASAREWHVRKALPEELKMVAEIERLSFSRPWSLESIESFYYRKTSDIYVWRDRNRMDMHTVKERMSGSSVKRTWEQLHKIIEEFP